MFKNERKVSKIKKNYKDRNLNIRKTFPSEEKIGMTGFSIKIIATFVMFIDHITASTFNMWIPFLYRNNFSLEEMEILRVSLRSIGRLSFPVFCFLVVEGFVHTKNIKRYILSMLIFGVISEVPFDMAIFNTIIYWGHQNVYFTLSLGLITLSGIKLYGKNFGIKLCIALGIAIMASLLKTDYGFYGVLLIVVLYIYRENRWKKYLLSSVVLIMSYSSDILITMIKYILTSANIKESLPLVINYIIESVPWGTYFAYITFSIFTFIIMELYNGKKGKNINKYLFYGFYPIHLLLLGILRLIIKK
ncbi:TraX family protein [Fusobacterium sp. PH5-44]|uniref:TraX family protein n=1 Tax=unclassified Fusobacterium TaxID=2648384 RepID=UPI003D1E910D